MLFSWCVVLFLASYGFSGADSNHVGLQRRGSEEAGGDGFAARSQEYDFGQMREGEEPGSSIISGGLKQVISLTSAVIDTTNQAKRKGLRSWAMRAAANNLEKKIKEAQLYATMMEKYIHDEAKGKSRSAVQEDLFD